MADSVRPSFFGNLHQTLSNETRDRRQVNILLRKSCLLETSNVLGYKLFAQILDKDLSPTECLSLRSRRLNFLALSQISRKGYYLAR